MGLVPHIRPKFIHLFFNQHSLFYFWNYFYDYYSPDSVCTCHIACPSFTALACLLYVIYMHHNHLIFAGSNVISFESLIAPIHFIFSFMYITLSIWQCIKFTLSYDTLLWLYASILPYDFICWTSPRKKYQLRYRQRHRIPPALWLND